MDNLVYHEELRSNKTTALFLALTAIFGAFFILRTMLSGVDGLAIVFLLLFLTFLFYSINFRTLRIELTRGSLKLTFGILAWTIPVENFGESRLDEIPVVLRLGGAGIHFYFLNRRYRASFNFLEYPRIAILLKRSAGPVSEVSFSTRRPEKLLAALQAAASAQNAARSAAARIES